MNKGSSVVGRSSVCGSGLPAASTNGSGDSAVPEAAAAAGATSALADGSGAGSAFDVARVLSDVAAAGAATDCACVVVAEPLCDADGVGSVC
ncbi:MAG TPA: hypothetical protein VHM70_25830 [Polyangiaceae bacterium]|nr:hypothetical protein [Polyangiaceae bacterium]